MMYKDKNRQRQAVREATMRYRAKLKGITRAEAGSVIPKLIRIVVIPSQHQSHNPMIGRI